jgi:hypothetical protein
MKKNIDEIIHHRGKFCDRCSFCLSRCLKCGSLDITVHMQINGDSFNYRNICKNRIYIHKVKKGIFYSDKKRGIKISCNKCGNTIKAIDIKNGSFPVLKTYNLKAPGKFLHGNSKYHIQLVKHYGLLDGLCYDIHLDDWLPCESVCLFFDHAKRNKDGACTLQTERVLDIKFENRCYLKGKTKLKVNYLKEFGKYYTVRSQIVYYRKPYA